jgi:hypothetical protein
VREQVQWTCESGERREPKRAAGQPNGLRALPTLSLGNPAQVQKFLALILS